MSKAETIDQARATPALDPQSGETPVLQLFHRHRALIAVAETYPDDRAEELDRLFYKEANAIQAQMLRLPSSCAADFAAKLIVDTCEGGMFSDWETGELWKEARYLTQRSDDPDASLPALYRKWKALKDRLDGEHGLSDEAWKVKYDRLYEIADLAMKQEPRTVLDLAAKIAIADNGGDMQLSTLQEALAAQAIRILDGEPATEGEAA